MDNALFIAGILISLFLIYAGFSLPFAILQSVSEYLVLNRSKHFSKGVRILIEGNSSQSKIFKGMMASPMIQQANILRNRQGGLFFGRTNKNINKQSINADINSDRLANGLIYALKLNEIKDA
ncbi:MAG: hypothetical protein AAF152_20410, partial [Cyanobacteria bacterium P01_A01_bin.114]